jgi:outer membrane lipoprotein SlyB
MKHKTHQIAATTLACCLMLGAPFYPLVAQAQKTSQAATQAPRVTGFDVEQVERIEPGAELNFTVWGTAGAAALLQIDGAKRPLQLGETTPGRYQGSYTVGRSDRINADSVVHVNLRRDNRVATATLGEALQTGWPVPGAAAVAPEIQSLKVSRDGNRSRVDTLRFSLVGTPGGQASVQVQGSQPRTVVLDETSAGQYTGSFVLPSGMRVDTSQPLLAKLRLGNNTTQTTLANAYDGINLAPRYVQACTDCAVVQAVNTVQVDGDGKVLGTVAGGVLGAVVGSQFGKGDGRTAAGVAGAVGGALLGREIQRRNGQRTQYEVVVRQPDGQTRTVNFAEAPAFKVGDSVRIVGDTLEAAPRNNS